MNENILSFKSPLGVSFSLTQSLWDGGSLYESCSLVSGLHGDRINGLYIASKLSQFLEAVYEGTEKDFRLQGKVQIFPAVNSQALETGNASWPFDGMDLDLAFPGNSLGETTERICHAVLKHTADTSYGIVLESAPLHYDCLPHVRLFKPDRFQKKLASALKLGMGRLAEKTETPRTQLMRYWADRGVPSCSIVCGKSNSFDLSLGDRIVSGLINLLLAMEVLTHSEEKYQKSEMRFFDAGEECTVLGHHPGFFIPQGKVGDAVERGQRLGTLQDVKTGQVLEEILSPVQGGILTLRDYPLTYEKEPIAVILKKKKNSWFKRPWNIETREERR